MGKKSLGRLVFGLVQEFQFSERSVFWQEFSHPRGVFVRWSRAKWRSNENSNCVNFLRKFKYYQNKCLSQPGQIAVPSVALNEHGYVFNACQLFKAMNQFGQNGCNEVVIEPRVVQFWSEIILVISNRTCAARSFDFEITRIISAQIALHSVQSPLFIYLFNLFATVQQIQTTNLHYTVTRKEKIKWSGRREEQNFCPN